MPSILEGIKQKETKALIIMSHNNLRVEEHLVAVDLWRVLMMSADSKYLVRLMCLSGHHDLRHLQRSYRSKRIAHKRTCTEIVYHELSIAWYLILAHSRRKFGSVYI
jgi:hypothetical protein